MSTLNLSLQKLKETKEHNEPFKLLSGALAALFPPEVQSDGDPLNQKMWSICEKCGDDGLLHYWLSYARKHPERCVMQDEQEGP